MRIFLAMMVTVSVLCGVVSPVAASSVTSEIYWIQIYPATAYMYVNPVTTPTGKPACATSSTDYALDMASARAKEVVATLLAAHAAKHPAKKSRH